MTPHSTPPRRPRLRRDERSELDPEREGSSSSEVDPDPDPLTPLSIPKLKVSSEPLVQRVGQWMPILVQIFGLGLIGYEAVLAQPKSATTIAAGLTLAIGGKLSDILRSGGL
jgi:hypothetical protein